MFQYRAGTGPAGGRLQDKKSEGRQDCIGLKYRTHSFIYRRAHRVLELALELSQVSLGVIREGYYPGDWACAQYFDATPTFDT